MPSSPGLPATLLAALAAAAAAADSEFCPTLYADYRRRQAEQFSSDDPYVLEEGGSAKHVPFLALSDDGATATVVVGNGDGGGGVWHPMVASEDPETVHFVTHIMVKNQDDKVIVVKALDPTSKPPASMTFDVPAGTTELTPYEWCNIHGLWAGEPVSVAASKEPSEQPSCGLSSYADAAWTSVHADFLRQQEKHFNSTAPYTEAKGEKHTPYIELKGDGTASVLVGKRDGVTHPMNGSPDGKEEPHWITEIYVVDHEGTIVAMESLDITGVDVAAIDFEVPAGAESLKAYSWCNLHGLWEGPAMKTASDAGSSGAAGARSFSVGLAVGAAFLAALSRYFD